MNVAEFVAGFLHERGVRHVFVVAGGMITYLVDSIYRQGKLRIVDVHHEQAAAFAADATGRITGVPGVAMATSGPGATNLITGIGSAFFDSSPTVFITGQVNRDEQKGSRRVRQLGFQETDIVSIAKPITKGAWQASCAEEVPDLLGKAFSLATSGRPGPVLVDIPMDVQRAAMPAHPTAWETLEGLDVPTIDLGRLIDDLRSARRPLLLAGGGINAARAGHLFRTFVERAGVPVVHSLMAVDTLPYAHSLRLGMIGTYGNRWANAAVGLSDFILVLGSRLDIRQTGSDVRAFKGDRIVYHVDVDSSETNNRVQGCLPILTHLKTFLEAMIRRPSSGPFPDRSEWLRDLADMRRQWPDVAELKGIQGINPNQFLHQLGATSQSAAAFVVDVGQHQMWAAQSLEIGAAQQFITSGGMGAMGFALPAGIGATFAHSGRPVVVISGDGSFQLNIQELETIASNSLPVKMVVLNNRCLGMVRQFQQSYFEERYPSTCWGYSAPDFVRIAEAYGIPALTLEKVEETKDALGRLWEHPQEPMLLQVMIDQSANVYPKIAFGRPMTDMEPFVKPVAMETPAE